MAWRALLYAKACALQWKHTKLVFYTCTPYVEVILHCHDCVFQDAAYDLHQLESNTICRNEPQQLPWLPDEAARASLECG